jgi:hypothetical protein
MASFSGTVASAGENSDVTVIEKHGWAGRPVRSSSKAHLFGDLVQGGEALAGSGGRGAFQLPAPSDVAGTDLGTFLDKL